MLAHSIRILVLVALGLSLAPGDRIARAFADPVHGTWSQITPPGPWPPGRSRSVGVYDPVGQRLVIFGGYNGDNLNLLRDAWALTLGASPAWTNLGPGGTPPWGAWQHAAIRDAPRERMVVFGGQDANFFPCCTDMRELSLDEAPTWTSFPTGGTGPTSRLRHAAIYDPVRERMVIFGGRSFGQMPDNQVWALTLSGTPTWSQILPGGTPPSGRDHASAIYDPIRDRMLLFGGLGSAYQNDVWALNLAGPPVWTEVTPGGTPPTARHAHAAIYDPIRDRMVVFAGRTQGAYLDDVWELALSGTPQWSALAPLGPPPVHRAWLVGIHDPANDRMIVFSGQTDVGLIHLPDTWALSWAPAVDVPTLPRAAGLELSPPRPSPASEVVTFEFAIPGADRAVIEIFDLAGRHVDLVIDRELPAGTHTARWSRRSDPDASPPAGLYFVRLRSGQDQKTRLLALID